jgi:hypothetical protein
MSIVRLSPYQEGVLVWLLDHYRRIEATGKTVDVWGIDIGRRPPGTSRSESAADSRALRRLEDRGLIERRNFASGDRYGGRVDRKPHQHRTTHITLTATGRDLAERLTE